MEFRRQNRLCCWDWDFSWPMSTIGTLVITYRKGSSSQRCALLSSSDLSGHRRQTQPPTSEELGHLADAVEHVGRRGSVFDPNGVGLFCSTELPRACIVLCAVPDTSTNQLFEEVYAFSAYLQEAYPEDAFVCELADNGRIYDEFRHRKWLRVYGLQGLAHKHRRGSPVQQQQQQPNE